LDRLNEDARDAKHRRYNLKGTQRAHCSAVPPIIAPDIKLLWAQALQQAGEYDGVHSEGTP
jgi:hypothetical protein